MSVCGIHHWSAVGVDCPQCSAPRTSPELLAALERCRDHTMSAQERFEQRVSFVYGQQDYDNPKPRSKEEIRAFLIEQDGYPVPELTPVRLERAARAISAKKRGVTADHPSVDATWTSYVGHARECIKAYLGETGTLAAQGMEARRVETLAAPSSDDSQVAESDAPHTEQPSPDSHSSTMRGD